MSNRVAIYTRVSTLHQIDKDSLPMQRKDLTAYCELMLDTKDYVIFEDAGYSGKNTERPQFQKMMAQIRTRAFTHLLVWKIDRISRNLLDFSSMYAELKELGVIFVSKNEQFDTSTAMGEAMLKIILVFAELERQMTSERVTATMISRAGNGLWNGGRVPYGYERDEETNEFFLSETEAPVVLRMHEQYLKQKSLIALARWFNERGYRARTGAQWSASTIRRILVSRFNAGDYQYNLRKDGIRKKEKDKKEWITIEDHHPAIVSKEMKAAVLSMLSDNRKYHIQRSCYNAHNPHVFGGVLFCAKCDKAMGSSPSHSREGMYYTIYYCLTKRNNRTKCDGKSVSDPKLGEFIFNYILRILNAQKQADRFQSAEDLEKYMLDGFVFSHIKEIKRDGLLDLYNVLKSGDIRSEIYGKDEETEEGAAESSELAVLRKKLEKSQRAAERLTNLYLYSDDVMSESQFIIAKKNLDDEIESLNEQIGFIQTDSFDRSISDEAFIKKASEFILAQKLTGKDYVSYKDLSSTVDQEVLQTFVRTVIDSIYVLEGHVTKIIFKNGMTHEFVIK